MIISYLGADKFRIKTSETNVFLTAGSIDIDGFIIDGPGEYERKNVFVEVPFEEKVFKILIEDMTILYLGKTKKFSDKQIEDLDSVDLLFLPCGQGDSMNLKDAMELSGTLDPSIIIPMLYETVEALKKEGLEGEISKSAKISKSMMPAEGHFTMFLEETS